MGQGADWLRQARYAENLSPLGENVADLLDEVWQGLYHMDAKQLAKVSWSNPVWIEIALRVSHLSTFDNSLLTALVVRCHDRMLRMEITGHAHGWLRLAFHQRKSRDGRLYERCPTIEEHTEIIRQHYARL